MPLKIVMFAFLENYVITSRESGFVRRGAGHVSTLWEEKRQAPSLHPSLYAYGVGEER